MIVFGRPLLVALAKEVVHRIACTLGVHQRGNCTEFFATRYVWCKHCPELLEIEAVHETSHDVQCSSPGGAA